MGMASWFEPLWHYITSQVSSNNIIGIVTALAFVTSFITYILTTVISRKVYIRLQRRALFDVLILFFSLALSITELIEPVTLFGIPNFFLKSSLVIWTVGLVLLIWLTWDVLSVDHVIFKKPKGLPPFTPFQEIEKKRVSKFGLTCVDKQLQEATFNHPTQQLYFPFLLIAEKSFKPWRLAARFAVAGLSSENNKEGVIYFAFNQPAEIVVDQLARRLVNLIHPEEYSNEAPKEYWNPPNGKQTPQKFNDVIVIDCYSKWLERKSQPSHVCVFPEAHKQVEVLYSDPRDPYDLSSKYKRAVEKLVADGIQSIRVIYDSISDFLIYSDPQLALQFIKHNMVWEDQIKISSLYVYIPGVPQLGENNPVDDGFLRWNSYCVVEFRHQEKEADLMLLEGLFDSKKQEKVKCNLLSDYEVV
jgi:hypothetical protein